MATAITVASYILATQGGMTAMKLQKLVYYSQAWSLVWRSQLLFEDAIEAWAAGPVVRSLYAVHRGRFHVSEADFPGNGDSLAADEREVIDVVTAHYGKYTAGQLSDLTHQEQPWQIARSGLRPTERGDAVIDPSVMVDYYSALARQARA